MVHGTGVGVGVGVGVGDGVGVAFGRGSPAGVVGVSTGESPGISGNVGITSGNGSIGVSGSGSPVAGVVLPGVGTGVAPAAKSPTFKVTFGTESSNTWLSIVMSPEPVTSME